MTVLNFIKLYKSDSDTAGITIFTPYGEEEDFVYSDFSNDDVISDFCELLGMKVENFEIDYYGKLIIYVE